MSKFIFTWLHTDLFSKSHQAIVVLLSDYSHSYLVLCGYIKGTTGIIRLIANESLRPAVILIQRGNKCIDVYALPSCLASCHPRVEINTGYSGVS